jgi:carbonic anhydrase
MKPVTIVVPFVAGGNTDMMARLAADRLAAKFGHPFVIENRGGAGGVTAAGQVARAAPDGYTFLFGAGSQLTLAPLLQKVSYDPDKDLIPVTEFGTGPQILGVKADMPVNTLQEFIDYAKARPGKLTYAGVGIQTVTSIAAGVLKARARLDMTLVPYKGGVQAVIAPGPMTSEDPDFFRRLECQQAPRYLWIGCSDSRVPANTIVGLDPGELFVHRNVANLASPQDANYLSVLQFAVDVLKVQHIMVVGHYGCGGVSAAIDGRRRGLVDHWLHPIRELSRTHSRELEALQDERSRLDRLCELNVMQQIKNVASDVFVLDAWARGQDLSVHGWVYSIGNGLLKDLNVTVSGPG